MSPGWSGASRSGFSRPTLQSRPERVWSWIGWLAGHYGSDREHQKASGLRLPRKQGPSRGPSRSRVCSRHAVKAPSLAGQQLSEISPALRPTAQDIAAIMKALQARAADDRIDPETWHGLLLLGLTEHGLPSELRIAAAECARGDAELLSILGGISESHAEGEAERVRRDAAREARQQAVFRAHRSILADRSEEISNGDASVLSTAASVYLGWYLGLPAELHFDPEIPPHERLRAFLGDALAERVTEGFIATLRRDNLPTANFDRRRPQPGKAPVCRCCDDLRRRRNASPRSPDRRDRSGAARCGLHGVAARARGRTPRNWTS